MYNYKCKIGRIIDGDTVELEWIDLGFGVTLNNEMVRIQGIDAPESRTSDKVEKIFGNLAKDRVKELLPISSERILVSKEFKGKFGRILGDILVSSNQSQKLSETLLKEHLAVPYIASKQERAKLHLVNRAILIENNKVVI